MNLQYANCLPLNRMKYFTVTIAVAVLLVVETLVAQQPATTFSNSPTLSPATNGPTVITSERLEVDYARNVFTFKGNVLAVNPQMTLRADKMVAFLGASTNAAVAKTNAPATSGAGATPAVQKITATGSVLITQEKRRATCGRAEYTADDGRVVLTEDPKVTSADGTITGEKITFWQGEDRMEVESGSRLTFFPEDKKPVAPDHATATGKEFTNASPNIPSTP